MKEPIIFAVIILIFIGLGYGGGRLHQKHIDSGPVVDTVYVSVPVKPDTVVVDKVIYRDVIKVKPILVDCTKIIYDTTFVSVPDTVYRSYKLFHYPYADAAVTMWAGCPVDSLNNQLKINWKGYYRDKVKPELGRSKAVGRYQGFVAGLVTGIGGFLLLTDRR